MPSPKSKSARHSIAVLNQESWRVLDAQAIPKPSWGPWIASRSLRTSKSSVPCRTSDLGEGIRSFRRSTGEKESLTYFCWPSTGVLMQELYWQRRTSMNEGTAAAERERRKRRRFITSARLSSITPYIIVRPAAQFIEFLSRHSKAWSE